MSSVQATAFDRGPRMSHVRPTASHKSMEIVIEEMVIVIQSISFKVPEYYCNTYSLQSHNTQIFVDYQCVSITSIDSIC